MNTESRVMRAITTEMRARRWHPVRIEDKSSTGTPDLNFHCGTDVWVELKRAKLASSGKWSIEFRPAQVAWLIEAEKVGRRAWLVIYIHDRWWASDRATLLPKLRSRFAWNDLLAIEPRHFERLSALLDFIAVENVTKAAS